MPLPAKTQRVFDAMAGVPAIARFVLVGGSALALRLHHRLSEDLDFLFPGDVLPHAGLRAVRTALGKRFTVERFEHIAERLEFENAGLDLDDYQQDYLVDGDVKLSFFAPDPQWTPGEVQAAPVPGLQTGRIRVAFLDALALLKAAVLARWVLTRDLFDLYVLIAKHGVSPTDLWLRLERAGAPVDTLSQRVRHAKLRSDDPGLGGLVDAPPAFAELQAFMIATLDEVERDLAARAARR